MESANENRGEGLPFAQPKLTESAPIRFLQDVLKTRLTGVSLVVILIVIFGAVLAGVVAPYDPNHQDYSSFTKAASVQHLLASSVHRPLPD